MKKESSRKGGIQKTMYAGDSENNVCRKGWMPERRDSRKEGFRKQCMQERRDARHEGFSKRRDAVQDQQMY